MEIKTKAAILKSIKTDSETVVKNDSAFCLGLPFEKNNQCVSLHSIDNFLTSQKMLYLDYCVTALKIIILSSSTDLQNFRNF